MKNRLAAAFLELRTRSGLSQTELANRMGLQSGQNVSNIERGVCSISPAHYRRLIPVFGNAAVKHLVEIDAKQRLARFRQKALGDE